MACAQASLRMLANTNKMELSRANFRLNSALTRRGCLRLPFTTAATAKENTQPAAAPASTSTSSSRALQETKPSSGGALQESKPPASALDRPSLATSLSLLDHLDPFRLTTSSVKQMLEVVDRLFGDVATPSRFWRVPWDLDEDEESFKLRIDMPGFGKDDVKVYVEDGVLVISAESNKEHGDQQQDKSSDKLSSRSRSSYHTRIALPKNIEVDKISAKITHGLLEVCIPKKKTEKQVVEVTLE